MERPGDTALPYAIPASDYPEFEPGTHLALISYGVEGFTGPGTGTTEP
jgi:hypothetical protein